MADKYTPKEEEFSHLGPVGHYEDIQERWLNDEALRHYLETPEENMTAETVLPLPRGRFDKDRYHPPRMPREEWEPILEDRLKTTGFRDLKPLDLDAFIHIDRTPSIDIYYRDMKRVLLILKEYYGPGPLYVLNGTRSMQEVGDRSPHALGIAIDLQVEDADHARRIMNAAYMTGIQNILPTNNLHNGQGHVHLDIGPVVHFAYSNKPYSGPWSG